jgi:hypothetical protein
MHPFAMASLLLRKIAFSRGRDSPISQSVLHYGAHLATVSRHNSSLMRSTGVYECGLHVFRTP